MSQETLNLPLPDEGEQGPYTLIGKARAKPGCEDALEQHLLALVEPTRREAGVLAYHIHKDRLDRSCFVFYEVWRSLEALKWHLAQPYIQAFLQERHLYLDGDLDIVWLRMSSPYAAAGCGPANPV